MGRIFFAGGPQFTYHNDPDKTAATITEHGATIGSCKGFEGPQPLHKLAGPLDFTPILIGSRFEASQPLHGPAASWSADAHWMRV